MNTAMFVIRGSVTDYRTAVKNLNTYPISPAGIAGYCAAPTAITKNTLIAVIATGIAGYCATAICTYTSIVITVAGITSNCAALANVDAVRRVFYNAAVLYQVSRALKNNTAPVGYSA
jgi:hypothetical protein